MNETTIKGLTRMGKDLTEIANGKTWKVTGRAFMGRDGIAYSAGMEAPKSNVKVFGWTLPTDLFTLADAKAFAGFIATAKHGDTVAQLLADTADTVAKLNHETRHAIFTAVLVKSQTKTVTADTVAELVNAEKAARSTVKTVKTATDYTAILGI